MGSVQEAGEKRVGRDFPRVTGNGRSRGHFTNLCNILQIDKDTEMGKTMEGVGPESARYGKQELQHHLLPIPPTHMQCAKHHRVAEEISTL